MQRTLNHPKDLRELGDLEMEQLQGNGNHPARGMPGKGRRKQKDMGTKTLDFGRLNFKKKALGGCSKPQPKTEQGHHGWVGKVF